MVKLTKSSGSYVVVVAPELVGSVHGDKLRTIDHPDRSISYRGVDRDPWKNLDAMFYEGTLDDELKELRKIIEKSSLTGFSPGVCCSFSGARRVQALSASQSLKDEIIRIASVSDVVNENEIFFGYDCYVDGFGSLLRLGMFNVSTLFADFEGVVNEYGLFSHFDDLSNYVSAFCERCEQGNLELIDIQQVSDTCFFQILGISEFDCFK